MGCARLATLGGVLVDLKEFKSERARLKKSLTALFDEYRKLMYEHAEMLSTTGEDWKKYDELCDLDPKYDITNAMEDRFGWNTSSLEC